jgi:methylmalonyl-CoA/ethylmalonyl-CoA epimerase
VIRRLDHLVFAVDDMDGAIETWEGTLGLRAEPPIHPGDTHMQLSTMALGDAFLELVKPTSDGHRVARFIRERGEGMFSLAFEVEDLDGAVRELRDKGVTVSDPEPGVFPGTRVARIPRDTAHGVAIQLIERP